MRSKSDFMPDGSMPCINKRPSSRNLPPTITIGRLLDLLNLTSDRSKTRRHVSDLNCSPTRFALATGRRGARTPAIVTQLLLLPVVYSLIGPSQQLLLGIAAGIDVVATFLLLISERSREWATAPYSREP